jgi:hypothetical protein
VAVGNGGTGATTDSQARTNLGLAIGSNVQAYDAGLQSISGLTTSANQMIYTTASDTYATTSLTAAGRAILDDADAAAQRTTLGLGTMATQASGSVTITGGTISGITDLAIADGGTGASDAATARTNLGLAIGTNVQAYDADLAAIAALAVTDGNFIVGNGTAWVAESGATARTSLGLGSLATASTISNDNWSGTDLSVANGGTGASDAGTARTNLGLANSATINASTGVNANNIVLRDGNGYIYANYINFNTGVENPTIANFFTDNGDGWVRKSNLQHVKNSIGMRAWVKFNGSSGGIYASGGVSSVTYNGTGQSTVNFSPAMPDTNYSAVCSGHSAGFGRQANAFPLYNGFATGSCVIWYGNTINAAAENLSHVNVAFFR